MKLEEREKNLRSLVDEIHEAPPHYDVIVDFYDGDDILTGADALEVVVNLMILRNNLLSHNLDTTFSRKSILEEIDKILTPKFLREMI